MNRREFIELLLQGLKIVDRGHGVRALGQKTEDVVIEESRQLGRSVHAHALHQDGDEGEFHMGQLAPRSRR